MRKKSRIPKFKNIEELPSPGSRIEPVPLVVLRQFMQALLNKKNTPEGI